MGKIVYEEKSNAKNSVALKKMVLDGFNKDEVIEIFKVAFGNISIPVATSGSFSVTSEPNIALLSDTNTLSSEEIEVNDDMYRFPNRHKEICNSFLCHKCNQGILISMDNGLTQIIRDVSNNRLYSISDKNNHICVNNDEKLSTKEMNEFALDMSALIKEGIADNIFIETEFEITDNDFDDKFCTCAFCGTHDTYESFVNHAKRKELDKLCYVCGGEMLSKIDNSIRTTNDTSDCILTDKCEECGLEVSYDF